MRAGTFSGEIPPVESLLPSWPSWPSVNPISVFGRKRPAHPLAKARGALGRSGPAPSRGGHGHRPLVSLGQDPGAASPGAGARAPGPLRNAGPALDRFQPIGPSHRRMVYPPWASGSDLGGNASSPGRRTPAPMEPQAIERPTPGWWGWFSILTLLAHHLRQQAPGWRRPRAAAWPARPRVRFSDAPGGGRDPLWKKSFCLSMEKTGSQKFNPGWIHHFTDWLCYSH